MTEEMDSWGCLWHIKNGDVARGRGTAGTDKRDVVSECGDEAEKSDSGPQPNDVNFEQRYFDGHRTLRE